MHTEHEDLIQKALDEALQSPDLSDKAVGWFTRIWRYNKKSSKKKSIKKEE